MIAFGTRPGWLEGRPLVEVYEEQKTPIRLLFTGQHDSLMERDFKYDYKIDIKKFDNRLDSIFMSILGNDSVFESVTKVLVQGDTASAYAVALASFHRKIEVVHLEAGLRSYDVENPYPEEFYRRCISNLTKQNLCVSSVGKDNLESERAPGTIHVVGNTVLDNIPNLETSYGSKILITMHRRENHEIMEKWFEELENLAANNPQLQFIFPVHPNPRVKKHVGKLKNVEVIDPLPHKELLEVMSECRLVITDSGGIQEESSFLKKKSVVCRKATERVEGLGTFSFLCQEPEHLKGLFNRLNKNPEIDLPCPYGDGKSSQKIYEILNR